eukprot:TRINITY_DN2409_c0_g1_i2.p1 TRINITY_DN2409_c0_g1~~TRINITY_DN2409_c0_g1_i2.p1  ORF type:complete len:1037 (+),score=295.29 TRINITY_DN2409_c0_g1_i2:53-3163(+)
MWERSRRPAAGRAAAACRRHSSALLILVLALPLFATGRALGGLLRRLSDEQAGEARRNPAPLPALPSELIIAGHEGGCDGRYTSRGDGTWVRGSDGVQTPYRVVTPMERHNVRAEPNTESGVIASIRPGDVVYVTQTAEPAAGALWVRLAGPQGQAGERWALASDSSTVYMSPVGVPHGSVAELRASGARGFTCSAAGVVAVVDASAVLGPDRQPLATPPSRSPTAAPSAAATAEAASAPPPPSSSPTAQPAPAPTAHPAKVTSAPTAHPAPPVPTGTPSAAPSGAPSVSPTAEEAVPPEWPSWASEGDELAWLGGFQSQLPPDQLRMVRAAVPGSTAEAGHLTLLPLPHCIGRELAPRWGGATPGSRKWRQQRWTAPRTDAGAAMAAAVGEQSERMRVGRAGERPGREQRSKEEIVRRGWAQTRLGRKVSRKEGRAEQNWVVEGRRPPTSAASRRLQSTAAVDPWFTGAAVARRPEPRLRHTAARAVQQLPPQYSSDAGLRARQLRSGMRRVGDGTASPHPLGRCLELRSFVVLLDRRGGLLRARGLPTPTVGRYPATAAAGVSGADMRWVRAVKMLNQTAACGVVAGYSTPNAAYAFEWDFVADRLEVTPLPLFTVFTGDVECVGVRDFVLLARRDARVLVPPANSSVAAVDVTVYDDEVIRVRNGELIWRWRERLPFREDWLTDCIPSEAAPDLRGRAGCDPLGFTRATSIHWDRATRSIVVGTAALDTVFALDMRSGRPLWGVGRVGTVRVRQRGGRLLSRGFVDSPFYGPASAEMLGTLADGRSLMSVFDTDHLNIAVALDQPDTPTRGWRRRGPSTLAQRGWSQALLLALNHSRREAEVLWAWPPPPTRGAAAVSAAGFFQPLFGDVDLLPGGAQAVVTAGRIEPAPAQWPDGPGLPPLRPRVLTVDVTTGQIEAELLLASEVWGVDRAEPVLARPGLRFLDNTDGPRHLRRGALRFAAHDTVKVRFPQSAEVSLGRSPRPLPARAAGCCRSQAAARRPWLWAERGCRCRLAGGRWRWRWRSTRGDWRWR